MHPIHYRLPFPTDFLEFAGNKYIVYADRFTGWVEVKL